MSILKIKDEQTNRWIGIPAVTGSDQEAINTWLEAHPEATTTVQDSSLTEAKFSDALKLKTVKDYVTPQMYGAKADGSTDDVEAFENALNIGKIVFIPEGDYYLSRAIDNPAAIKMIGAGYTSNIRCGGSFLKNRISSSYLADFRIYCNQENNITAFPAVIAGSCIYHIWTKYFYAIFEDIESVSIIDSCNFQFIQGYFCNYLADSFLTNNYINAPKVSNPQTICFKSGIHSTIANNFIDYMYKVFNCTAASMKALVVTGNVFDVCFCIFYDCVNGVTFTGNTIANLKKRDDWDVSGNDEMNTKLWCVIKRVKDGLPFANSVFTGNSFQAFDEYDMYMDCETSGYPTYDFLIDELVPASKINYFAYKSNNPRDFENVMIRPMLKRTVTELPKAALSGESRSFNHDEVVYNSNLYINLDGTWVQMTNSGS